MIAAVPLRVEGVIVGYPRTAFKRQPFRVRPTPDVPVDGASQQPLRRAPGHLEIAGDKEPCVPSDRIREIAIAHRDLITRDLQRPQRLQEIVPNHSARPEAIATFGSSSTP